MVNLHNERRLSCEVMQTQLKPSFAELSSAASDDMCWNVQPYPPYIQTGGRLMRMINKRCSMLSGYMMLETITDAAIQMRQANPLGYMIMETSLHLYLLQ